MSYNHDNHSTNIKNFFQVHHCHHCNCHHGSWLDSTEQFKRLCALITFLASIATFFGFGGRGAVGQLECGHNVNCWSFLQQCRTADAFIVQILVLMVLRVIPVCLTTGVFCVFSEVLEGCWFEYWYWGVGCYWGVGFNSVSFNRGNVEQWSQRDAKMPIWLCALY